MIVATLNRTLKALAWPRSAPNMCCAGCRAGTHDWRKFLKPEELRGFLATEPRDGARARSAWSSTRWPAAGRLSSDADVNYMMVVERAA